MTPNVAGAVSGPEDCNHMREGSNVATSEPNPLSKYPDVKVAPQSPEISERVAAQDDTDGVLAASSGGSDFPFGWVLGCSAAIEGIALNMHWVLQAKSIGAVFVEPWRWSSSWARCCRAWRSFVDEVGRRQERIEWDLCRCM